jgi:hypothetical protein
MKAMKVWSLLLLLAFVARAPGQDAQKRRTTERGMRPEEILIRTAYAKMSFADEVRIVLDALQQTGRDKLWTTKANSVDLALDSRLSFELKDFHFGKIKEIADLKIGDFDGTASAIGGEVLDVTPSVYNYSADGSPSQYVAYVKYAWKPSPYRALPPQESWPVAKVLQEEQFEHRKYTDYVTYTVTMTLQNKSRTYKAWMLFSRDGKGKPQVYFMDAVADSTAVLFASEHSMYPKAFTDTDLRTVPFVDKWLYDNARSCSVPHNEKDDRADVCCDYRSGHCGVARSSLGAHDSRRIAPAQKPPQLLPASFRISSLPVHAVLQSSTSCSQFMFRPATLITVSAM